MGRSNYKPNPKMIGSGMLSCIPQTGTCPNNCPDCFFQVGRSYLEPLDQNLPNVPTIEDSKGFIIRVNDGNDSNVDRDLVIATTKHFEDKFYNTAIPKRLAGFPGPVVLTVNPGLLTDKDFHKVDPIPCNLMFVRACVNCWNLDLIDQIVEYYTDSVLKVPVVLTFMAYFEGDIPEAYKKLYIFRRRTLNSYWAITTEAWKWIMERFEYNSFVYSCGKVEGEKGSTLCRFCGNCLREYYATKFRVSMGGCHG